MATKISCNGQVLKCICGNRHVLKENNVLKFQPERERKRGILYFRTNRHSQSIGQCWRQAYLLLDIDQPHFILQCLRYGCGGAGFHCWTKKEQTLRSDHRKGSRRQRYFSYFIKRKSIIHRHKETCTSLLTALSEKQNTVEGKQMFGYKWLHNTEKE